MSTQISIPTLARGRVRAFIKSHGNFASWCTVAGLDSREVKNAQLIEFAEKAGILPQVLAMIAEVTGSMPVAPVEAVEAVEAVPAQSPAAPAGVFDMGSLLSGVEVFLSPLVRAEIEKALGPVIEAANKPAVETIRTIEVSASPVAPQGQLPFAVKTGKTVEFNKLFGTRTSHGFGKAPISLWNSHGAAPQIDQFYVVDANNMGLFATAAEHGTNVWLVGPGGSGKTSLPQQFAAYTGRPFFKFGFTKQTEVGTLIGGDGFKAGETRWNDGALVAALKRPGSVILFDEITLAPAGVQALLQGIADDHRSYTIHQTGEVVRVAPGVMLCVADNTNGTGDESGRYAGTNQSNGALVNRFKRMIRVEYLSKAQEVQALMNWTGIVQPAAEHVVDFFTRARRLPEMDGAILSLRQMTGFVGTVKDGFPSKVAFEVAVLNALPNTERAALEALSTLEWNAEFEQRLTGSAAVVEPMGVPDNSAGSKAFDDEVSADLNRY
jgi:MoxR-like ATPase